MQKIPSHISSGNGSGKIVIEVRLYKDWGRQQRVPFIGYEAGGKLAVKRK